MNNIYYLFILFTFSTFGQPFSLGENYLDQGEYEKAASIFKELVQLQPNSQKYVKAYSQALVELERFEEAENSILNYLNNSRNYPNMDVELGQIYALQGKNELAIERYTIAIESIQINPNFAYVVGRTFQDYNLLDEAAEVYEKADAMQPSVNYKIQLARIYGEQAKLELMFKNYIHLIIESPNYFNVVSRNFNDYITENSSSEANVVFKKLLLKEMQKEPNVLYNQLLSWVFIQEGDYNKAFAQEKAIYKRSINPSFQGIIELANLAARKSESATIAEPYLDYVIKEANDQRIQLSAIQLVMQLKVDYVPAEEYPNLVTEFETYLNTYGITNDTASLQLLYARFLAFQLNEPDKAQLQINTLLNLPINAFTEASAKMLFADIFVLQEQFNQALVYYSQVEKLVKNTDMAQEAKYKVAKTSYYKGDFEWAVTQLNVLKKATSQLIANDAMDLARHIKDNSYQDSTQYALQKVAKADLLAFQEKNVEAIAMLNSVIDKYKSEPIEDEALFRKAKLQEKQFLLEDAAGSYQQIIDFHSLDVLADDALFALAQLYENKLKQPEKAKTYYEKIIFEHPDSIFFVDAQKAFRKLRGDVIN